MKISHLILSAVCFFLSTNILAGQIDTLLVNSNYLKIERIKIGTAKYLTYLEMPNGVIRDASIWERTTSIEMFQNEKAVVSRQNWKNQDSKRTRSIKSVSNLKTMQPIYQWAKNGKGEIEAFNFYSNKMVAADSISDNKKKGFQMDFPVPIFNWELDLEFLPLLKLKKNQCFGINFYHPGSKKKPKTEYYTVEGKSMIFLPGNRKVTCWVVTTQYAKNNKTKFWIEEKTNQIVKVKDHAGPIKRYKILLY